MHGSVTWEELRQRVQRGAEHDLAARERLMPRDDAGQPARPTEAPPGVSPRPCSVLVLLYPHRDELYLPLTVRTASLRNHSGEVSFPGGSFDPADGTLEQTALREAWEELGVVPANVEIVAGLTPVWIPVSNFRITPYVGFASERPSFNPAPDEVAALLEVPLNTLADHRIVHSEIRTLRGRLLHIPFYAIGDYKVWGATALILAQLLSRLAAQSPEQP